MWLVRSLLAKYGSPPSKEQPDPPLPTVPVAYGPDLARGLLVGEIFDLDELAEDCAGDRVYEFLFVAPPLPITGAVGSPVNPLAVK